MDVNGRVQAIFIDNGLDRLRYATCSSVCTTRLPLALQHIEANIGVHALRRHGSRPATAALEMLYLATDGTVVKFAE